MADSESLFWICPECKAESNLRSFLGDRADYDPRTKVVHHRCQKCSLATEAQLLPGEVRIGYTYAAGVPHFASVEDHAAPRLRRIGQNDHIQLFLNGETWCIHSKDSE